MFEKYCKGQRLRALLKQDGAIDTNAGRAISNAFTAPFDRRRSGTLVTDILALSAPTDDDQKGEESALSKDEFSLLSSWYQQHDGSGYNASQLPKRAIRQDSFTRHGARFTTHNVNRQDSHIIVGTNVPENWDAARLDGIILHRDPSGTDNRKKTFLLVRRYKRLAHVDMQHDYYQKFPIAGGRLYYDETRSTELVTDQSLLGHFSLTPQVSRNVAKRHFHSLPLDKVRAFNSQLSISLTLYMCV